MKKEHNLVLVSSKKEARINQIVSRKSDNCLAIVNPLTVNDPHRELHTTQHLYLLSDEKVKKGDWYIVELFKVTVESDGLHLEQCKKIEDVWVNNFNVVETRHIENCKKIIATTNPDLWNKPNTCGGDLQLLGGDGESGEGMEFPFLMKCKKCNEENFYNEKTSTDGCYMHNGTYTTECSKISIDFTERFVKEWNKDNKIEKVNLVYGWTGGAENGAWIPQIRSNGTVSVFPIQKILTQEDIKNAIYNEYDFIITNMEHGTSYVNKSEEEVKHHKSIVAWLEDRQKSFK